MAADRPLTNAVGVAGDIVVTVSAGDRVGRAHVRARPGRPARVWVDDPQVLFGQLRTLHLPPEMRAAAAAMPVVVSRRDGRVLVTRLRVGGRIRTRWTARGLLALLSAGWSRTGLRANR